MQTALYKELEKGVMQVAADECCAMEQVGGDR